MRFMIMHKLTPRLDQDRKPEPGEVEHIHALMGEAVEAGIMRGGEGLRPSAERLHIAYRDGERTITEGPFSGLGELAAGFAVLAVRSRDEAIGWMDRFAAVLGDVELFLGPVTEAWHLGFAPKPDDAPLRFLAVHRANESAESGQPPDPEHIARMGALIEEMTEAGVLQTTEGLAPTMRGARIHFDGDEHSVIDGPFAESKELLSGYVIFELASKAEAIEWGIRWGKTVDVHEVEVRQLAT